jgi:hypothetical protein
MRLSSLVYATAAAAALSLAGCEQVPESPPKDGLLPIAGEGVEHLASGMVFPASVGGFSRESVRQNDHDGWDVSASYSPANRALPVSITVDIYPSLRFVTNGSVDTAREVLEVLVFAHEAGRIAESHDDPKVLSVKPVSVVKAGRSHSGMLGRIGFTDLADGSQRNVYAQVLVYPYVGGKWTVAFRITYPAEIDGQPTVDRFLAALDWTVSSSSVAPGAHVDLKLPGVAPDEKADPKLPSVAPGAHIDLYPGGKPGR